MTVKALGETTRVRTCRHILGGAEGVVEAQSIKDDITGIVQHLYEDIAFEKKRGKSTAGMHLCLRNWMIRLLSDYGQI